MTRDKLVVPGGLGESDWTKPGSAKIVCFYSLSAQAPRGGVGPVVRDVTLRLSKLLCASLKYRIVVHCLETTLQDDT